eukprot:3292427-Karenia_brevis.AAC.1
MMKGFVLCTLQWKRTCFVGDLQVSIAYQQQIMTQESQEILELSAAESIIQHGAGNEESMSFI